VLLKESLHRQRRKRVGTWLPELGGKCRTRPLLVVSLLFGSNMFAIYVQIEATDKERKGGCYQKKGMR